MTAPARGRPTEIDPSHLARTAIALFEERGYDAVSMTDIAAAAGVSRRSLFRYFGTKADLIWDGFVPVVSALDERLARAASGSPFETLAAAFLDGVSALPELGMTRTRLSIISSHPELIAFGSGQLHSNSLRLVQYLRAQGYEELTARITADVFTTTAFNAYVHWAVNTTDASPRPTVERALAALRSLTTAGEASGDANPNPNGTAA